MKHELRLFFVALQFLTRLPVRELHGFEPRWLHDSARYFAAVGLVVGAAVAATLQVTALIWPMPLATVMALGAGIALTGAFHEDGLADTWDALGGAVPRERALIIMKDSRLGSYGAIALVLALVCKALALHALALASLTAALWALVLLHAVSRAATVCVIAALPYAGDEAHAKAKPLARQVGREAVAVALGTCAAAAAVAWVAGTDARALLALAAAATVAAWMSASWLRRRLGGYTGDGLGAIQQHVELAGLLTAAVLPAGWLTA